MLRRFRNLKRVGLLATVLTAGAMLTPASVFAADRGHGHEQARVTVQHFDRGRQMDRGHIRVERGRTAFVGGVVVNPVPEYVPVPVPDDSYYAAASPYAYQPAPAPACNTAPYGY